MASRDVVQAINVGAYVGARDSGRLKLWLDTWGAVLLPEELRRLLYSCGADSVADPLVTKPDSWAREQSA